MNQAKRVFLGRLCFVVSAFLFASTSGFSQQAENDPDPTRLPDGRPLPVNETWAVRSELADEELRPRSSSETVLLPEAGLAILGAGAGDDQMFAWLNFTVGEENKHRDMLSIGLFGHGQEVLPDLGHTRTRYRNAWAASMMSHNTVVVDGREPSFDADGGGTWPVAFATNGQGFHLAAAESRAAYPKATERYRRTLILLGKNANDAYLLDVFEVKGGKQHDYLLHGNADRDSSATLGGSELRPFRGTLVNPGAIFGLPDDEDDQMGTEGAFALIKDLRRGTAREPLRLDFQAKDGSGRGSRTVIAPLPDAEIFLGRSPSIRRADEDDAKVDDYTMPTFVVRNRGENLNTVFVTAHEAVGDYPRLHHVLTRRDGDRLWISVTHAGGRDYISMSLGETSSGSFETSKGTFTTDASYAVVRLDRNDDIRGAHLVEGSSLQFRQYQLKGPGAFTGKIRHVRGSEPGKTIFDLNRNLALKNPQLLLVEFPDGSRRGYNVTRVEHRIEGSRVHVREAPGFAIEKGEIKFDESLRVIEGTELSFRLIDSTHLDESD